MGYSGAIDYEEAQCFRAPRAAIVAIYTERSACPQLGRLAVGRGDGTMTVHDVAVPEMWCQSHAADTASAWDRVLALPEPSYSFRPDTGALGSPPPPSAPFSLSPSPPLFWGYHEVGETSQREAPRQCLLHALVAGHGCGSSQG